MKKIDLRRRAEQHEGEYVFGAADTGSHAAYMLYGVLKPGERERIIKPGKGHEELIAAVKGSLKVTGHFSCTLEEGHAFHLAGEQTCFLENKGESEAVYIIAGGHSSRGHSH